jgi:dihydroflavonol-4-reductase
VADVADVAAMHVIAIDKDAAKGKRFVASAGSRTFVQIAQALKTGFPQRKITTTQAPNFVIRLLSLFDADIRAILPTLGKHSGVSSRQAQNVLGIDFIPIEDSLVETASYLIDNGFVKA